MKESQQRKSKRRNVVSSDSDDEFRPDRQSANSKARDDVDLDKSEPRFEEDFPIEDVPFEKSQQDEDEGDDSLDEDGALVKLDVDAR